jgi:preprotein translocase subunit SecY
MTIIQPCNSTYRVVGHVPNDNCAVFHKNEPSKAKNYDEPLSKAQEYITSSIELIPCSTKEDISHSSVLQAFIGFAIISFILILIAIVFFNRKYRSLRVKYSKLGDEGNGITDAGEVEM